MFTIDDYKQRQQALSPTKSFIVQAPAGSGKTELLIQRFLTLLSSVKSPEEVLAITFTKKSANEMRARIVNALQIAASEPCPQSPHAQLTWQLAKKALQKDVAHNWSLIDNPNQLQIKTIDSFCSFLTKQLPLASQFGSTPAIMEDPQLVYREAIAEVLTLLEERSAWSDGIRQLLVHLDNDLNKLHNLLIDLLAKRDQWLPYIHLDMQDNDIRKKLESYLAAVIEESLQTVNQFFPKNIIEEFLSVCRIAAENVINQNKNNHISLLRDITTLPTCEASKLNLWQGIANLLLTKQHQWRKRFDADIGFLPLTQFKNTSEKALQISIRNQLKSIIHALQDHEELRLALAELSFLPSSKYAANQWKVLQALFQTLKIATAQLRVIFQQSGKIDFIENAQSALLALGHPENPTDLALALDYQIRHILIDEFQDTSIIQYQLLEKLIYGWEEGDGRTLFIVGDPMQSIYRFRKAEVGLFIRMQSRGIGDIQLTPLYLTVNFRSNQPLVEWNNKHFKTIFPSQDSLAKGAVTYKKSIASKLNTHSAISAYAFINSTDELQAQQIVEQIKNCERQFPLESIAILVRSRSHLNAIIPALKQAQISYKAIDIDSLATRQYILDLLSLTCALLHPADRIAWLSVLRAPWCGITLNDLSIIAQDPHVPILAQLKKAEIVAKLSSDAQLRISSFCKIIFDRLGHRERTNLSYWIESTWLLLGGPACLPTLEALNDVKTYFNLLETYSQNHSELNIDELKTLTERLFATPQLHANQVQIMTIHSAKGLEFDTVILPHLEKKMPSDDKALLSWLERPIQEQSLALLLAPIVATGADSNAINDYIAREHRIRADYETDRLLYVATTRAKKNLHLYFNLEASQENKFRIEGSSFLAKLWPQLEKSIEIIDLKSTEFGTAVTKSKKQFHRLATTWRNPVNHILDVELPIHNQQSGFHLQDNFATAVGIAAHKILQLISTKGIEWWTSSAAEVKKSYIKNLLIQQGIYQYQLNQALEIIIHSVANALNDKIGQWILHPHQLAQSELPLSGLIKNKIQNIIIDRTFVDEENRRWIIDYKTSTFTKGELSDFLLAEQLKYQHKMYLYSEIFKQIEDREIHIGLYFPALPAWHSWSVKELSSAPEISQV